jgi:hypothetical protein
MRQEERKSTSSPYRVAMATAGEIAVRIAGGRVGVGAARTFVVAVVVTVNTQVVVVMVVGVAVAVVAAGEVGVVGPLSVPITLIKRMPSLTPRLSPLLSV